MAGLGWTWLGLAGLGWTWLGLVGGGWTGGDMDEQYQCFACLVVGSLSIFGIFVLSLPLESLVDRYGLWKPRGSIPNLWKLTSSPPFLNFSWHFEYGLEENHVNL
jgi:hypothetical protein